MNNIVPTAFTDGVVYASAVPLVSTEASLGNTSITDPISVIEGQEVVAVVKLSITGIIVSCNAYVVMQTDMGDGTWIDIAWIVSTQRQGTATYVLCAGGRGAMNNAIQQSRDVGQAPQPQANGSNAIPLGGRIRFVGKSTMLGGSSSAPGLTSGVYATITYKLTAPR